MSEKPVMSGLRTLGPTRAAKPQRTTRTPDEKKIADKAKRVLHGEFKRALELKAKLSAESAVSADAKGRDAGESDKLRSLVASLEGMSRFAIAMKMLTPAENRAIWAEHIKQGLYEGWR